MGMSKEENLTMGLPSFGQSFKNIYDPKRVERIVPLAGRGKDLNILLDSIGIRYSSSHSDQKKVEV